MPFLFAKISAQFLISDYNRFPWFLHPKISVVQYKVVWYKTVLVLPVLMFADIISAEIIIAELPVYRFAVTFMSALEKSIPFTE